MCSERELLLIDVATIGFGFLSTKFGWRFGKVPVPLPKRLRETRDFVVSS
jgi:hypothetical protein